MKKYLIMVFTIVVGCFSASLNLLAESMSELNLETFDEKAQVSQSGVVQNPFASARPSQQDVSVEDLYLTGIAVSDNAKYALVSGYILSEGDSVAGLRVKKITKNKVVLQYLDRIHTLHLDGGL